MGGRDRADRDDRDGEYLPLQAWSSEDFMEEAAFVCFVWRPRGP